MFTVTFYENKSLVMSQLLKRIPTVDEEIKLKGKKGKVVSVDHINESNVHIHLIFEKVKKQVPTEREKKRK